MTRLSVLILSSLFLVGASSLDQSVHAGGNGYILNPRDDAPPRDPMSNIVVTVDFSKEGAGDQTCFVVVVKTGPTIVQETIIPKLSNGVGSVVVPAPEGGWPLDPPDFGEGAVASGAAVTVGNKTFSDAVTVRFAK